MFSLGCCCSDASDKNSWSLHDHSTTDGLAQVQEHQAGVRPYAGQVVAQQSVPQTPPVVPQQGAPPVDDGPTARSLTEEEKQAEKARLQGLVNSFAKRAVRGCPCEYIREGVAERVASQYRIDKSLELLSVHNAADPSLQEVSCPIAAIQDIYALVEDGETCFPQEVVKVLRPEERDLLLMVVYKTGDKMFRFCILEETKDSRDIFLECLRILCIYAQSAPGA
mmetsp:Transcript_93208/g.285269  ORF Transcript_93208/g.285269 Transcript_93208/m.285269 type:complete len:223 (-) Transcript_93208:88-756(-)